MIFGFDNTKYSKYEGIKKWENKQQEISPQKSVHKKNSGVLSSLLAVVFAFVFCAVFVRLPSFESQKNNKKFHTIVDAVEIVVDNFYNGISK